MSRRKLVVAALLALPLVAGSIVLANQSLRDDGQKQEARDDGYICPVTGEELPCPKCCPLQTSR
jgi:hypothetical protein